MHGWSRLKKKLFILMTAILIASCLCIYYLMTQQQSFELIGTYVIYEGGYIAPEVM